VDLLSQANVRLAGAASGDMAGWSVAGAGDVNRDGRDDVIVGAQEANNNSRKLSGSAYVVFGRPSDAWIDLGDLGTQGFRIDGAAATDFAGETVAAAGDVNGDGHGDVIVGAWGADSNGYNSGSAYVVLGSRSSADVDLAALGGRGFRIDGVAKSDQAGRAVAGAGDVNGDGRDDVVVGAWAAASRGRFNSGSAYVVFGSSSTAAIDLNELGPRGFRVDGPAVDAFAGKSVGGAGDFNGDGRGDVVVTALRPATTDAIPPGVAYVVFGTGSSAPVDLAALRARGVRIDGAAPENWLKNTVAGAGDVNGDGHGDVVLGEPEAGNSGRPKSGSAYVVFGSNSTTAIDLRRLGTRGFRIDGARAGDAIDRRGIGGFPAAWAGDLNGDGHGDVILGAPLADNNRRSYSGSAYVVFGSSSSTAVDLAALGTAGFRIDGAAADNLAGNAVAGAGDVNGDGRGDVIIGAPFPGYDDRVDSGAAYVVFGR
jgi:hypothetical protein